MLPTLLPERPQYWAEFVDNPSPTTISVVAMFGWMLIDNEYEQNIYQAAIRAMQKLVNKEWIGVDYPDYVYAFNRGRRIYWHHQRDKDLLVVIDLDVD